jgi:hypothetical protein
VWGGKLGFWLGGSRFYSVTSCWCRTHYILSLQVIFGYYDVLNEGWCRELRRYPQSGRGHGGRNSLLISLNVSIGKKERKIRALPGQFLDYQSCSRAGFSRETNMMPSGTARRYFRFRSPHPSRVMRTLGFAKFLQVTKPLLPCDLGRA